MRTSNLRAMQLALVLALPLLIAKSPPGKGYLALAVATYGGPSDSPLSMPTGVSVGPDGTVYVADGVADRVVAFLPDGSTDSIGQVGGKTLSRPLGLEATPDGRLWIADTGHHRVLVRGSDGRLERILTVPDEHGGGAADLSDVAVAADGHVYLVDNAQHRLLELDPDGRWTVHGTPGEGPGQFHNPFMIAVDEDRDLYVSDVINGRVQVITRSDRPTYPVGSYGVDVGQLYRPKGVALDAAGNLWVADSVLGVIQIFGRRGAFLDVLRDGSGRVLRLQSPSGLAFDSAGDLYVVELTADRVQRFAIQRRSVPELPPATFDANPDVLQPRDCTACHFEWMPALMLGSGTVLAEPPPNSATDPYVSRPESCLSCHDGSVEDSRRTVWREHGHSEDVVPPPEMVIPPELPLSDGKLACRTCHSAHTLGGSGRTCREAMFLRVENRPGELCLSCHPR